MIIEASTTLLGELALGLTADGIKAVFARYFSGRARPATWHAEIVTRGSDPAVALALDALRSSGIPEDELDKEVFIREWIDASFPPAGRNAAPRMQDALLVSWTLPAPTARPVVGSVLWATYYARAQYLFVSALGSADAGPDGPWCPPSLYALYDLAAALFGPRSGRTVRAVVFESEFPRPHSPAPAAVARADRAAVQLRSFREKFARFGMTACRIPVDYRQPCTDPGGSSVDSIPLLLCAASSRWEPAQGGGAEITLRDAAEIVNFVYDELYMDAFSREDERVSGQSLAQYQAQLAELKRKALARLGSSTPEVDALVLVSAPALMPA